LKKGFTLIELLVVISIIALLLSLLTPSLVKTKEHTRRVVCASFLHQFTAIANIYSQDYDGLLPSFVSTSGPHTHDLAENFVDYLKKDYGLRREELFCPSLPKW